MEILLISLVLLVLAVAIVVLFAMLGELASRVPEPTQTPSWLNPLEEVRSGAAPASWPAPLADLRERERAVVLVLSPICTSCRIIASELARHADWPETALVVSASNLASGRDFVAEYGLGSFPYYVDEHGEWVRSEFGLERSPTALVLRGGQLASAYTFSDIATLRSRLPEPDDQEVEKV